MSSATDVSLRFLFVDAGRKGTLDCSLESGCAQIASEDFLVAVDRSRVACSLCSGRVILHVFKCRDISLARPKMKPAPSARALPMLRSFSSSALISSACVMVGSAVQNLQVAVAEVRVLVRLESLVAPQMLPLPYSRH
jgi:hypothetical protein